MTCRNRRPTTGSPSENATQLRKSYCYCHPPSLTVENRLRLRYGAVTVLLTGDIEARAEVRLLGSGAPLAADVLKVAHLGSGGSSTAPFLQAVQPRLALIGVGLENRYGHPAPETLARLGDVTVRRTDADGEINVMTDGREVWLG